MPFLTHYLFRIENDLLVFISNILSESAFEMVKNLMVTKIFRFDFIFYLTNFKFHDNFLHNIYRELYMFVSQDDNKQNKIDVCADS